MKVTRCCICGQEFVGYGNNPEGAAWKDNLGNIVMPVFSDKDRCCGDCDGRFVIPGRLYRIALARGENRGEKPE